VLLILSGATFSHHYMPVFCDQRPDRAGSPAPAKSRRVGIALMQPAANVRPAAKL
jgi:hypothetical protein